MFPVLTLPIHVPTAAKTAPLNTKRAETPKVRMEVGHVFNFLPNMISYSNARFAIYDTELLQAEVVEFMQRLVPFAVPRSSEALVYVSDAYGEYNTLVLLTSRNARENVLFSISLLQTYTTSVGIELNEDADPQVLDYIGYRAGLAKTLTEVQTKLNELQILQRRPRVVLRGEVQPTQDERRFLLESDPVIKKNPRQRKQQQRTVRRPSSKGNAAVRPMSPGGSDGTEPTRVEELDNSDSDGEGRPAL